MVDLQSWGTGVAIIAAFLACVGTFAKLAQANKVLGEISGRTEVWAGKFSDHSDNIQANTIAVVRFGVQLEGLFSTVESVEDKLDLILSKLGSGNER